jgi:hypothetical protein
MTRRFYAWGIFGSLLLILAGCTHSHDEDAVADDPTSITRWTDKTEVFVEFPALIVGRTLRLPHISRISKLSSQFQKELSGFL